MNNIKVFASTELFAGFYTTGTNNNVIKIGPLEFARYSNGCEHDNDVYCSFQGSYLKQVLEADLDEEENARAFAFVTESNGNSYIKLAVPKSNIDNIDTAIKFITGMLIEYKMAHVTAANNCRDSLYEVSTYLPDGTLVSNTVACPLQEVAKKIMAFEANHDINEVGYYRHVVRLALIKRGDLNDK